MSSYLSQFNYQFLSAGGKSHTLEEIRQLGPRRKWIFLHGLMGYAINWRKIVTNLGPNDLSLIFDQRGHGKSWKPEKGYAPEDYAEDLLHIVDEIGWSKFILVGHSMGGRNALMFTARHAEKVEKLIIEDIGPEAQPKATEYYEKLFAAIPTPFPNKLKAKEFFLNDFLKVAKVRGNGQTLGLYLYSNIIEQPNGQADWRFSKKAMLESIALGRAKDHWAELRALSVPTLVLRGAQSDDFPRDVFEKIPLTNPRVEILEIPDAGHWIHYDQPEVFIRVIKQFADGTPFDRN